MRGRIESLTQKLLAQCENENKLSEGYQQEIKAQTKLADLYKGKISFIFLLLYMISFTVKSFWTFQCQLLNHENSKNMLGKRMIIFLNSDYFY